MLKSTDRSDSLRGHGPAPLEAEQVKYQQIIEPEFAIATAKDKHLIVDNARGVKLSHGRLSTNDGWYVETKFVHALLQINEDHV